MTRWIRKTAGFTLIELIVVVGIFSLVFSSSAIVFGSLIQKNSITYHGSQLVQMIREARTNAVSQKRDSAWGIHFNHSTPPYSYTLFKGESYAGRDPSFDLMMELPSVIAVGQFDLGGSDDLVFGKSDGSTTNSGVIGFSAENSTYSILINELGLVDFDS